MPVICNTLKHFTHLNSVDRPCIWIPIAVNNNSIVTLVYEVCTSTNIIQIRRSANPTVQLLDTAKSERGHTWETTKSSQRLTCLGCATNQTWQPWCWANRLILVSIWLTYSVSVLSESKVQFVDKTNIWNLLSMMYLPVYLKLLLK